jgi:hypothetical protein
MATGEGKQRSRQTPLWSVAGNEAIERSRSRGAFAHHLMDMSRLNVNPKHGGRNGQHHVPFVFLPARLAPGLTAVFGSTLS